MGNCFALSKPRTGLRVVDVAAEHGRVLQIVKMDGKVLEFSRPMIVKDILENFSGSVIGLSREATDHLPPNYELKIGKIYYLLPSKSSVCTASPADVSSTPDGEKPSAVKRIKIVITRQQLQDLLAKQISVQDVLSGIEKQACKSMDHSTNWTPKLESIPEGCE